MRYNTVHLLDDRRAVGVYFIGAHREDGTGYVGKVYQFPVICAADIIEQPVTMRSRREQVVTTDARAVGCRDCKGRLNNG